jgi:RND family efflux transporter MFP subunit
MEAVAQACLALYCEMIPGATSAVAVLASADGGTPTTIARWPEAAGDVSVLTGLAAAAVSHGRTVTKGRRDAEDARRLHSHVAVPFQTQTGQQGAVALELGESSSAQPTGIVDLLHAGAPWLAAAVGEDAARDRLGSVLELVGFALELEDFASAATHSATELATRLGCERVSIGFLVRNHMQIEAISHSARFDERAQLMRTLAGTMEEAVDQDAAVLYPAPAGSAARITRVHAELAEAHGAGSVCTVPIASGGEIVGAFTFEWPAGKRVDADIFQLCQDIASLLGPILEIKRQRDASFMHRVGERTRTQLRQLREPGHTGLKLAGVAVVVCLLSVGFVKTEHRVTAEATLEGRVQRAIVAGLDGYIGEAHARAGDVVRQGQVLGVLDQRDLVLERQKLSARRAQLRREYREALAGHDRTQVNILGARVAQAEAQLRLVEENLTRTQLVAPFDGVVVKGDLSQSLGSPVEKGEVLFEIAPLDGYRIILKVDERDIAAVSAGAPGRLALAAHPGRPLALTVERITPVSTAADGQNYFRVEARLDEPADGLRPGMEGVGKLRVGRRSLLWIWTHDLLDWLRLWTWSWWP